MGGDGPGLYSLGCLSVDLVWVLDAPWLCGGSWCKVRWAKRAHPLGNSPVEDLRQLFNLFPSV